jgi:hypothetical protein
VITTNWLTINGGTVMSCAAPEQGPEPAVGTPSGAVLIEGRVLDGDRPVPGAFVRLLDATGEFTAEVVSGDGGHFRFYAAPGRWTLRALAPGRTGTLSTEAEPGRTVADIALAAEESLTGR